MVEELLTCLQDVAFLPTCGIGESVGTTTCHKIKIETKEEHSSCKIPLLQQILFFASIEFHGDHKTITKMS